MPRQRFIAVDAVIYTSLKQIKTLSQFDSNRSECMYVPDVSKFSFFVRDSTYLKCVNFPTHAHTDRMTHIELRRKNIIQSCLVDCQS